jgi:hypothetical protein
MTRSAASSAREHQPSIEMIDTYTPSFVCCRVPTLPWRVREMADRVVLLMVGV